MVKKRPKPKFKPASRRLRMKDLQPGMILEWRSLRGRNKEVTVELYDGRLSFTPKSRHPYDKWCYKRPLAIWSYNLYLFQIARGPW